ncbi:MAG: tetratricopeptide repeat protein [Nannocystaceae bacterium]
MTELDLDSKIDALRQAVARGDGAAVPRWLEAIEQDLRGLDPMVRGLSYAEVQAVLGRPAKAAAVLEDLVQVAPEVGVVHHQLGAYRRGLGDAQGALAAFTRATELDPSLVAAWIERGVILDAQGEPRLAVESYRHAILRAPTEADGWRNLGNSLAALACFDEAIEAYRIASRLLPDDATLVVLLASAHQAKGDLQQANAQLGEALRAQLGEVIEVTVQAEGIALGCRFHAVAERRPAWERAAERVLRAAAVQARGADTFPLPREGSFVVQHAGQLLLCDADAVRPERPHRFLDATRSVARAAD